MACHYGDIRQDTAARAAAQERHDVDLNLGGGRSVLMRIQRAKRGERRIQQLLDFSAVRTCSDMPVVAYATSAVVKGFRRLVGNVGMLGNLGIEWVGIGDAMRDADLEVELLEDARVRLAELHHLSGRRINIQEDERHAAAIMLGEIDELVHHFQRRIGGGAAQKYIERRHLDLWLNQRTRLIFLDGLRVIHYHNKHPLHFWTSPPAPLP